MSTYSRARWWTKITRSLVLFTVGVALTIREALTEGPERPSLYVIFAGMMGLGEVLRYAESRQRSKDEEP